jgi:hypothetical protein
MKKRNAYRVLVGKPKGKRPPGRPIHKWKDNIKIYLRELRCGGMNWNHTAQDTGPWRTLVNTVLNLRVQ